MSDELNAAAQLLVGTPDEAEKPETEEPQEIEATEEPEPETEQEPTDAPEGEDNEPEPLTVKQLAEKLETSPKKLYEDLVVPIGNGKTMTLSELKDRGAELLRADEVLQQAEDRKLKSENELMRKSRELAAAQAGYTPEQAQKAWDQMVERENALSLKAIEGWSDSGTRLQELEAMSGLMSEYGFSEAEQSATIDHRLVKLIRDYTAQRNRLSAAKESEDRKVSQLKGGTKRKAVSTKKSAVERYNKGELNQAQAILSAIADGAK